jgi:hypothetical protein
MLTREQKAWRRATAYHEAGHAVVAWIMGQRISSIRIYAESNREGTGVMRLRNRRYSFLAMQMLHEASESCPDIARAIEIVVLLAGQIAEERVVKAAAWKRAAFVSALGDLDKVIELLAAMDCTKDQTEDQLLRRVGLLDTLCSDYIERHWKHIEALAGALLANGRILKAKEIRQILGPRTMPLRKAIEDVRLALQEK